MTKPSFQNAPSSSCVSHEKSIEERAARNDKSMEELLIKERTAKTRTIFCKATLLDDDATDDENTVDILKFYKPSSSSSIKIPSMEIQGDKSREESLAREQMEKSMHASPS